MKFTQFSHYDPEMVEDKNKLICHRLGSCIRQIGQGCDANRKYEHVQVDDLYAAGQKEKLRDRKQYKRKKAKAWYESR